MYNCKRLIAVKIFFDDASSFNWMILVYDSCQILFTFPQKLNQLVNEKR